MVLDSSYFILVLPAMLLAMWAQFKVKSTFKKYLKVRAISNKKGAEVARALLDSNRLYDVPVQLSKGSLSDHYDPRSRTVRLSPEVYNDNSVASLGVAAHEVGHAIQHAEEYFALKLRHNLFPVANIGSNAAMPLILIGFLFNSLNLLLLGIVFFSVAVLFQVVTLPVEFNASSRALTALNTHGFITRDEIGPTRAVLSAAALTYVAATIVAIAQLLHFILLFMGRRD